jgi:hypothetical protein
MWRPNVATAGNPEHANRWGELGPPGIIEHETRGVPSRIVITKSWHKDCFRAIPLFDRKTFLRPDVALSSPPRADAVKVGRRASRAANSDFARPHLDGGEHGGTLAPCRE